MTTVSPVSTAISAMNADCHHHRHDEQHRQQPEDTPDTAPVMPRELPRPSPAPATEPQAPTEGTFVASQLAERLRLLEANLLKLATGQTPWQPPHSDLNLRDRTV